MYGVGVHFESRMKKFNFFEKSTYRVYSHSGIDARIHEEKMLHLNGVIVTSGVGMTVAHKNRGTQILQKKRTSVNFELSYRRYR